MNNQLIVALKAASRQAAEQAAENGDAGSDQAGALTMGQLLEATGYSRNRLRDLLWELQRAGLLESTRVPSVRIDGSKTMIPAYRMLEPEEAGDDATTSHA